MTEDEGFLQRWSRRKQASVEEEQVADAEESGSESDSSGLENETIKDETTQRADADVGQQDESGAEAEEVEPLGDEDMPPLESIDQGGSVTPFMSPRVSEGLRRAALRRLFRQPKYNVVDMLDDYAEDYSTPVALGDIVTSDMRYRAEQAAKRIKDIYKESLDEKDSADVAAADADSVGPDADESGQNAAEHAQEAPYSEASDSQPDQLAEADDTQTPSEDSSEDPNQKPA
jgi:hypothetical protein